jgi:hypothetical protein
LNIGWGGRIRTSAWRKFQARQRFELPHSEQVAVRKRGRPRKQSAIRPVAAFTRKISDAANTAFDRETRKRISATQLMTYVEALAQYHLRPEAKFLNGDFCDRGRTERRRVMATQIIQIGKEANKWEEQHFLGADEEAEIEYGADPTDGSLDDRIRRLCKEIGQRAAAKRLGVSRMTLRKALEKGSGSLRPMLRNRVAKERA